MYSDIVTSKVGNTNNLVLFSDSINSANSDIRLNFNKELKNGRARFKYLSGVNSNSLIYFIGPAPEEGKFDTAAIHIGINDMLNSTSGAHSLTQKTSSK